MAADHPNSTKDVAWLALLYRTAQRDCLRDASQPLYVLESDAGHVTLALLEMTRRFSDVDWTLVRILIDKPDRIPEAAKTLAEWDLLRTEALLHAAEDKSWTSYAGHVWAEPFFRQRWWAVERAMRKLVDSGL